MNKVEEVAKAIYEKRNGKGCTPWAKRGMAHKAPYFADARAAIEAMRDPSEWMKEAGAAPIRNYSQGQFPFAQTAGHTFRHMIDAALSEEKAE